MISFFNIHYLNRNRYGFITETCLIRSGVFNYSWYAIPVKDWSRLDFLFNSFFEFVEICNGQQTSKHTQYFWAFFLSDKKTLSCQSSDGRRKVCLDSLFITHFLLTSSWPPPYFVLTSLWDVTYILHTYHIDVT